MISIPVPTAEIIDKLSILHIKMELIKDRNRLKNIKKEFQTLSDIIKESKIKFTKKEFNGLVKINRTIWDCEEIIRGKDATKSYDKEFIQAAKKIYYYNDLRAALKKEINVRTQSEIIEEKSYNWFKTGKVTYA